MCSNQPQPQDPHRDTTYEQIVRRMLWLVIWAMIVWPILAVGGAVTAAILLKIQNPLIVAALLSFPSTVECILYWIFRQLFSVFPMDEKRFLLELEKAKLQMSRTLLATRVPGWLGKRSPHGPTNEV